MIGKFGGKQSLEEAMMYLIIIMGVGVGITFVGSLIEDDANSQIQDMDERSAKDTESILAKNGYYEDQIVAKIIVKDIGGWLKLVGIVLLGMGFVMMRTSPSKNI